MGAPFLRRIETLPDRVAPAAYPFDIPAFSRGIDLTLRGAVTFLGGENGSGKSTLLEALAECCGFNPEGGSRDHHRAVLADWSPPAQALRLTWQPKVTEGCSAEGGQILFFAGMTGNEDTARSPQKRTFVQKARSDPYLPIYPP